MRRLICPICNTASADETAQVIPIGETKPDEDSIHKVPSTLTHPKAVRTILPLTVAGIAEPYVITGSAYTMRSFDTSSETELLKEIEAHSHEITAIRLWTRKFSEGDGLMRIEPWVISTGLDGIIRKWRLKGV